MNPLQKLYFAIIHHRFFILVFGTLVMGLAFLVFGRFLTPDENQNNPYAYEIAAAFLGTLLTITITAMLLRHQTDSEVGKERSVKIYETKLEIYKDLLKRIEDVLEDEELSELEFFQLQLAFQKVVFIAGPQVLVELPAFASVFAQIFHGRQQQETGLTALTSMFAHVPPSAKLQYTEKARILHAFGRLAAEVRADLHSPVGALEDFETEDVLAQIEAAFHQTEVDTDDGWNEQCETFLHSCDTERDKDTYRDLFRQMENNNRISFEPVGFTLRDDKNRILIHIHPVCSMPNKIFRNNLSPHARAEVQSFLATKNVHSWHFRTRDFRDTLPELVQIVQRSHEKAPPLKTSKRHA